MSVEIERRAAAVLRKHRLVVYPDGAAGCDCEALYSGSHEQHQAAMLAAEGLLTIGTTEPRCEHTEHATRGDGRYGRHFETADPAGAWEPCPSPPVTAASAALSAELTEAKAEIERLRQREAAR
jgi:hypothetical protein